MKEILIPILLLFISTTSFAKKTYTMTKEDFANQFNDNYFLQTVYCQNEKGEKVWLYCNNNTILTINLTGNKTEDLMLQTIKLKQQIIEAIKYNVWMPSKKVNHFKFSDVVSIVIEQKFQEYERPYFSINTSFSIAKQKNDSIKMLYSDGYENIIVLTNKEDSKTDTFLIMEGACYDLIFKNKSKTEYGVVQKITVDSIYVTNFFNSTMANANNKPFEVLAFHINDIKEIRLLKSGGYTYKHIKVKNTIMMVERKKRTISRCPIWFAVNSTNGNINLYRLWQIDGEPTGITESDGKAIWYEGETTGW